MTSSPRSCTHKTQWNWRTAGRARERRRGNFHAISHDLNTGLLGATRNKSKLLSSTQTNPKNLQPDLKFAPAYHLLPLTQTLFSLLHYSCWVTTMGPHASFEVKLQISPRVRPNRMWLLGRFEHGSFRNGCCPHVCALKRNKRELLDMWNHWVWNKRVP